MRKQRYNKQTVRWNRRLSVLIVLLIFIVGAQKVRLKQFTSKEAAEQVETVSKSKQPDAADDEPGAQPDMAADEPETQQSDETVTDLEPQVLAVAAKEIGAGSHTQAIQAQCVIARTNLFDAKQRNSSVPAMLSLEEMQNLWGSEFNRIYKEMETCVKATEGEILTWNGAPVYAAYHAVSSGRTRNMTDLYADAAMPYLVQIECHRDTTAEGYLSIFYFEKQEFLEKCRAAFPKSIPENADQIFIRQQEDDKAEPFGQEFADTGTQAAEHPMELSIAERDGADYVLKIKIGNDMYTGEEFRTAFALPSSCFTLTELDEMIRIVTKGVGHGFGLSQHTAQALAQEGADYREILAYFYPGTKIEKK